MVVHIGRSIGIWENFTDQITCSSNCMSADSSLEELVYDHKALVTKWFTFSSSIYTKIMSDSATACTESWKSASDSSLGSVIQIIEQLKHGLERYQLPVSWSHKDLNKVLKCIVDLQEYSNKQAFSAKFEWITGLLIKAIEYGEWVVLENAKLCNPTVLDRINSIVETSGSITVNECGLVDGKPVVLHPNGKFRLFFTVNPSYVEVSRAMQNRGVEVCMMQPNWVNDGNDGYISKETEVWYHFAVSDFLENVGRAWLHVGELRFHLLLTPDNLDPIIKYSTKNSQIVEKISFLELEIKVRQECEELVGRSSSNDVLKGRKQQSEKLEVERKRILRKVVYRHNAS